MAKKKTIVALENTESSPEIIDEEVKDEFEDVKIENIKSCKILKFLPNGKAMISFEKYGLIVDFTDRSKNTVDIKFDGEIGKPNFKYETV